MADNTTPTSTLFDDRPPRAARELPTADLLQRWRRRTLSVLGLCSIGVLGAYLHAVDTDHVAARQNQAKAKAGLLAAELDATAMGAATRKVPGKGGFAAWTNAPQVLQDQHGQLVEFVRATGGAAPVYTLQLLDARRRSVSASPGEVHDDAMARLLTSADPPSWRAPQAYRPGMGDALFQRHVGATDRYSDATGHWVSAYAPLLDEDGDVVGIVGVDEPVGPVWARLLGTGLKVPGALLGWLAVAGLLGWGADRALRRRFRELAETAEAIADGLHEGEVALPDDLVLGRLALALDDLQHARSHQLADAEAQRAALLDRLEGVVAGLDEASRRRRARLAELSEGLSIGVEAPNGERREARLVDLDHESLVVAMPLAEAPTLARGMSLRVFLRQANASRFVRIACRLSDRHELDASAHLVLQTSHRLTSAGLPCSLGEVLEQRRHARQKTSTQVQVRAAVRRDRSARPVPVSVVDLSTHGMQLILPLDLDTVSGWGVGIEVALQLSPKARPLRILAHIRSADPSGGGSTRLGIEFDGQATAGFEENSAHIARWMSAAAGRA